MYVSDIFWDFWYLETQQFIQLYKISNTLREILNSIYLIKSKIRISR